MEIKEGYIQSWIDVIEKDPNELFKAIDKAKEAADYALARSCYLEIQKEYEQGYENSLEMDSIEQTKGMELSM